MTSNALEVDNSVQICAKNSDCQDKDGSRLLFADSTGEKKITVELQNYKTRSTTTLQLTQVVVKDVTFFIAECRVLVECAPKCVSVELSMQKTISKFPLLRFQSNDDLKNFPFVCGWGFFCDVVLFSWLLWGGKVCWFFSWFFGWFQGWFLCWLYIRWVDIIDSKITSRKYNESEV